jgi:hypothetical protein
LFLKLENLGHHIKLVVEVNLDLLPGQALLHEKTEIITQLRNTLLLLDCLLDQVLEPFHIHLHQGLRILFVQIVLKLLKLFEFVVIKLDELVLLCDVEELLEALTDLHVSHLGLFEANELLHLLQPALHEKKSVIDLIESFAYVCEVSVVTGYLTDRRFDLHFKLLDSLVLQICHICLENTDLVHVIVHFHAVVVNCLAAVLSDFDTLYAVGCDSVDFRLERCFNDAGPHTDFLGDVFDVFPLVL